MGQDRAWPDSLAPGSSENSLLPIAELNESTDVFPKETGAGVLCGGKDRVIDEVALTKDRMEPADGVV